MTYTNSNYNIVALVENLPSNENKGTNVGVLWIKNELPVVMTEVNLNTPEMYPFQTYNSREMFHTKFFVCSTKASCIRF